MFDHHQYDPLDDVQYLYARAGGLGDSPETRPPVFKAVGISLAVASGVFIGISFVLKKVGLLKANVKYNEEAGEGYGYLKNAYWWGGMILMIIGEICNFVAYAFVDAILVTPLGALSVVITTVLSAIFLKERLSFVGKVGCLNCIIGSVVIAMNAPSQSSVATIQDMQAFVITPGFLTYAGILIVACVFVALWAGPRYGKQSMFVYISICSLIGGLSVVATQGLGAAIIAQIGGKSQFKEWFLYVLFVFVIATLLTEIIYLNKALNIFNAALVTPTYYVFFTSATIVTSAVLFQGFKGTGIGIATVIMGFLQICTGVILLQLSKSAKDVPDAAVFKGDLDQVREVAEQEEPETEPKADAIRGAAAIIRRISSARQKIEAEDARRYYEERRLDELEPPGENEIIEWDGLRRRRTIIGESPHSSTPSRRTTIRHPPLGMSKFPDFVDEDPHQRPRTRSSGRGSILGDSRSRASSNLHPHWKPGVQGSLPPLPLTTIPSQSENEKPDPLGDAFEHKHRRERSGTSQTIAWADERKGQGLGYGHESPSRNSLPPAPPPHSARRQFSFQNIFNRRSSNERPPSPPVAESAGERSPNRIFSFSFGARNQTHEHKRSKKKNATEEETLGLVKGDSPSPDSKAETNQQRASTSTASSSSSSPNEAKDEEKFIVHKEHVKGYHHPGRTVSASSSSSAEDDTSTTYRRGHDRIPSYDKEEEEEGKREQVEFAPHITESPTTLSLPEQQNFRPVSDSGSGPGSRSATSIRHVGGSGNNTAAAATAVTPLASLSTPHLPTPALQGRPLPALPPGSPPRMNSAPTPEDPLLPLPPYSAFPTEGEERARGRRGS
ncbi:hypothetical protein AJ80_09811 [Polytolypa hystricis UAMH7299]|uniref:Uncharacterized protein n=1 Tax=Polytolypa hystricis (strain UAMH7299) TaxID=1447883 RepID=A0A2B7WJA3_POLH7|nr:hypothetical protein AJ80_09811 [Polytolypa hystricis UAMH7299]